MGAVHKVFGAAVVVGAGFGLYWGYKTYFKDDAMALGVAEDDYWAGLNFGITGWAPQLPIHPKSQPTGAEAIYAPPNKIKPGHIGPDKSVINPDLTGSSNALTYTEELYVLNDGGYASPNVISNKRGKAWTMQPARTRDYANPAQAVPSTGYGGTLAPIPGVNVGYVNADLTGFSTPFGYTEELYELNDEQAGNLTPGPLPPLPNSGQYKRPFLEVVNNG